MLIRRAEVEGQHVDVRLASAQIQRIEPELAALPGESVLEAEGGALLPGLHDHHLHLFALAAALNSVRCGPPEVEDLAALSRALRAAAPRDGWVRGVGYHESVAGVLDRDVLDRIEAQRPVRVQHRSGALWCINSAGLARLEIDASTRAEGIERSPQGRVTGRLFRMDGWLRERLQVHAPPALDEASARLARYGVTGVTDATPGNAADALERLVEALESGALRQRVLLMGSHELPEAPHPELARGPVKLLLDERALPTFDWLCEEVRRAHD
jgi:predicted amidohydrolase YtcJ